MDYAVMAPPNITFLNGNFTYVPKCIKVKANTMVTFAGNFMFHNLEGGPVVSGVGTPATSGPFVPATTSGMSATFTMSSLGRFPYYCIQHQGLNMSGAVFVVP